MSPPSSCAIITRAASRETRNEPLAITSCCRSQSLTVVSSSGLDSDRPALLTTRSTPPNASTRRGERGGDRVLVGHVGLDRDRDVRAAELVGDGLGLVQVEVGDDDAARPRRRAGWRWPCRCPEPAPVTSATRVASGLGLGIRCELGLLQRPVLDAELLRLRDRGVGGHRLGAAHHVDRVDVELAGDPGGLLVLAEGEHPHARAPARSPGRRRASPGESGVALRS